jgi:hypothetical protein
MGPIGMSQNDEIARFVRQNNTNIGKLETGLTQTEVQVVMAQEFDLAKFPSYASDPRIRDNLNGAPRIIETYRTHKGKMTTWYYYTKIRVAPDRRESWVALPVRGNKRSGYAQEDIRSDKHFTPLCFINGKLTGWGRTYFERATKAPGENGEER